VTTSTGISSGKSYNAARKQLVLIIVGCFLFVALFYYYTEQMVELVDNDTAGSSLRLTDFAYYTLIAKAFWFEQELQIYNPEIQAKIIAQQTGSRINFAMPVNLTPIGFLFWWPISFVAKWNLALSYAIWACISLGLLMTSAAVAYRYAGQVGVSGTRFFSLLFFIGVTSTTTMACIYLGQTALFAAAILFFIVMLAGVPRKERTKRQNLTLVLLCVLLAIKPNHFGLAVGALLIFGEWVTVLWAGLGVLGLLGVLTLFFSSSWMSGYIDSLALYLQPDVPKIYEFAFVPEAMNVFRTAFQLSLGEGLASGISLAVFFGGSFAIVLLGMIRVWRRKESTSNRITCLSPQWLVLCFFGLYLTVSPHCNMYDETLLLSMFLLAFCYAKPDTFQLGWRTILLFLGSVVTFHWLWFASLATLWIFWLVKVFVIGWLLVSVQSAES